jgi:MFS superfamily sulfate permease-like transporter
MSYVNPLGTFRSYPKTYLSYDLKAGLSVFLVALPLCLGIALASGAPLFSGLVAGIIGGIVVGFLSGSEVSVSGPAAGLAVIVADAISRLGSYEVFLVAVMLAGFFQVLLGIIRAGKLSSFFPDSVIKGMLAAIGIVIFLKQLPHALGRDNDYEGEFEFQQLADGENTISEIYRAIETASTGAVLISLLSLAVFIGWDRLSARGISFFKAIPSALIVVLVGIGLNEAFRAFMPAWYMGDTAHQHMVQIPILAPGKPWWSIFTFPDWSALNNSKVWGVGFTIALVASLETLLNLEASDQLDSQRRVSSTNQELLAQGVGNLLSGLIGGLPVTSVVVRTSANVFNGAKTRLSAVIHGILLTVAVFAAGPLLNYIPLSCLAALLLVVGYKLAKPAIFKKVYKEGISQFIPFVITIVCIILTDLLIGVLVGLAVGYVFVLYTNAQASYRVMRDGKNVLVQFQKDVYFLSKAQLKETLQSFEPGDSVVVDGRNASFIDHDIYTLLQGFKETARRQGIDYELRDVSQHKQKITRSKKNIEPAFEEEG